MVRLGFLKKCNFDEILSFLLEYRIVCVQKMECLGEYQFIEVETQALMVQSLCCWGRKNEVYTEEIDKVMMQIFANRPNKESIIREMLRDHEEPRRKVLKDADFWISFIKDYVQRYESIILHRYYDDVIDNVPNTLIEITLDQLTIDDLLKMGINQMLLIHL